MSPRQSTDNPRLPIHADHGTELRARSWQTEAPLRMLMNNLDPDVAERPDDLVVYGGNGKAARDWNCYHAIVTSLRALENDETLLVQSGKPVGVFRTHEHAPRVLIANSNLVGKWATWDVFRDLERQGLMMACLEEIAYRMGYIDAAAVRRLAEGIGGGYGQYLLDLLEHEPD